MQAVRDFVTDAVLHESEGGSLPRACLYISGVPGTGKTACVTEVMRTLDAEAKAGKLPPFQFSMINALRLPTAQHMYSHLARILTGAPLPCWLAGVLDSRRAAAGSHLSARTWLASWLVRLAEAPSQQHVAVQSTAPRRNRGAYRAEERHRRRAQPAGAHLQQRQPRRQAAARAAH